VLMQTDKNYTICVTICIIAFCSLFCALVHIYFAHGKTPRLDIRFQTCPRKS